VENRLSSMVLVIFRSRKSKSSLRLVSSIAQWLVPCALVVRMRYLFKCDGITCLAYMVLKSDKIIASHHCYHPISFFNMICPLLAISIPCTQAKNIDHFLRILNIILKLIGKFPNLYFYWSKLAWPEYRHYLVHSWYK
jgi:hypothetical protein